MTAPHDTRRRGDERRWAPRPIFACDECGFASTMDYRHCPFEPHHDLERPPTAYKPLREMVVEEVAPVQSEGERDEEVLERAAQAFHRYDSNGEADWSEVGAEDREWYRCGAYVVLEAAFASPTTRTAASTAAATTDGASSRCPTRSRRASAPLGSPTRTLQGAVPMPERQHGEVPEPGGFFAKVPEAAVEAAHEALLVHVALRCGQCAGTGYDLRSNLDCTPCDATGLRRGLPSEMETEPARDALAAAMDPALGDQRLVPLADVLNVLRGVTAGTPNALADFLARTFGGEPG